MKVLITGGAGYFGSVLSQRLLSKGHQVRVVDRLMHGGEALLSLFPLNGFDFVLGDLRDASVRENALDGVDAVVHLAAIVGDPACAKDPQEAREVNIDTARTLLDEAKSSGVHRFVFASTCSNYGKMNDPKQHLTEESDLRPVSLYAESKVGMEHYMLDNISNGSSILTVLRISTLYGLSPRMRFDLTVNEFTMELINKKKLVVYGEQFWRPYVHVRDASRAVNLVLESNPEKVHGQVFNVGDTRENYTKGQLVKSIVEHLGGDLEIERVKKDEDPRDYRVNFQKIKDVLGFRITRTVSDGIAEVAKAVRTGVISDVRDRRYRNVH